MFNIIKESDWESYDWDGGEASELYIYPNNASFQERNFKSRISIAFSKEDKPGKKSRFKKLPGINRFLSIIDGEIEVFHEEHYNIKLSKYEIERFRGDWSTYTEGKYTHFNLMLNNIMGDLYFKEISKDVTLHLQKGLTFSFIFVIEGDVEVNEDISLSKRELLISDQYLLNIRSDNAKIFYGFVQEW